MVSAKLLLSKNQGRVCHSKDSHHVLARLEWFNLMLLSTGHLLFWRLTNLNLCNLYDQTYASFASSSQFQPAQGSSVANTGCKRIPRSVRQCLTTQQASRFFLDTQILAKHSPTKWIVFYRVEVCGWDLSTIQATLTPEDRRGLRDKCKEQLAETSDEPFLKQQPFAPKTAGDWETNVRNSWENTPKNLSETKTIFYKKTEDKHVILPQNLYGWRPPK